ncbi:MAG: hypothetical protein ACKVH8_19450 [Pirellulales bacterium]
MILTSVREKFTVADIVESVDEPESPAITPNRTPTMMTPTHITGITRHPVKNRPFVRLGALLLRLVPELWVCPDECCWPAGGCCIATGIGS